VYWIDLFANWNWVDTRWQ